MTENRVGEQTLIFHRCPHIIGAAAVVGTKEGQGPMGEWFDVKMTDDIYGEKTWEKAESKMLREAVLLALQRAGKLPEDLDALLSGDLINQLMSSSFMARELQVPFLGLYGACSTMTESLILGAVLIDGGYAQHVAAAASSHYCTAERQFRMPLEHGNQRPPWAQWTVTGSGAMILSEGRRESEQLIKGKSPYDVCVTHATIGKIVDAGIKDVNQMGAAMAPAAVDSLVQHFRDTGREPSYYDVILTGDLGTIGKKIVIDMMEKQGLPISGVYDDCGAMMFHEKQDAHSGGSGCGCSASMYAGRFFKELRAGTVRRALLISTGALLSTISCQQGESIPGIAHCVSVVGQEGGTDRIDGI